MPSDLLYDGPRKEGETNTQHGHVHLNTGRRAAMAQRDPPRPSEYQQPRHPHPYLPGYQPTEGDGAPYPSALEHSRQPWIAGASHWTRARAGGATYAPAAAG